MDYLSALQEWYACACDGDWEHTYGIKIETLDNPGWVLRVDISDTLLKDKPFNTVKIERTEHDWIFCRLENNSIFVGFGGSKNLTEIIQVFTKWAYAT